MKARMVYSARAKRAAKAARMMLLRAPDYRVRGREAALLMRWYRAAMSMLAVSAAAA